jgi:RNA polymerase sigma factor (sigma-70 family)
MPPPPPTEPFASRVFLGPALRAQPDRRLVRLVRDGYETAFEEIVRRYRKPLDRFAASFVGSRSEDVTQDAFSKALLALRGTTTEIELKPWLYRIVRNTALNDIRDRPPTVEQLEETLAGGESAALEAERREEMTELMDRLRALPEPQRAAIVMRELEGLSHEEIAASLGVSGGAARQAIYRARASLRNGFGLLVPLPLLRALIDHGATVEAAGGAAAAGMATSAAGAAGAGLGGIGAGGAVKAGLATVLIAGSVGAAGVAIEHDRGGRGPDTAEAAATSGAQAGAEIGGASASSTSGGREFEFGDDRGGAEPGDDRGDDRGRVSDDRDGDDRSGHGGGSDDLSSGRGRDVRDDEGSGHHSGRGSGSGRDDGSDHGSRGSSGSGSDHSESGGSGSSGSGSGHSGSGSSGSKHSGLDGAGGDDGGHHSGSGSSGSGDSGSSESGGNITGNDSGSGQAPPPPPPVVEEPDDSGSSGSGSDSGSSDDG